jgi:hypothetical protein
MPAHKRMVTSHSVGDIRDNFEKEATLVGVEDVLSDMVGYYVWKNCPLSGFSLFFVYTVFIPFVFCKLG